MILKNIFFSYSRADASEFALKLAVDLQKEGFNVWIDQQDIRAGSEWDLEIEKALETCDCLLFIESEKSVVSNNVLDEVYCAMDDHKIVIPVIYKDSKTPFRLKRLQHIDFTTHYETGLANLLRELKQTAVHDFAKTAVETELQAPLKPPSSKSPGLILIIVLLVVIAAVAITFLLNNKKELPIVADKTAINKINDTAVRANDGKIVEKDTVNIKVKEDAKIVPPEIKKVNEKRSSLQHTDEIAIKKPDDISRILPEALAGRWDLENVEPEARSHSGYMDIEAIDEKKIKVSSNFQFYYFKTNDTAFFSVFNGYIACASCILQNEITITDYDLSFGAQIYKILRRDERGVGNAGDTVMSGGPNSSIRAFVSFHLLNNTTALIKIHKPVATPIDMGFVVKPFSYTFRFAKRTH
ncbi:MAG: toll/interleukin-1 receptor domain-containing protein [Ferruginibacter sp.]